MIKKNKKIAQEARRAFEKFRNDFKENIDQYHYYHNFILGQQWDDAEEDMLKNYKKQPLQVNKCPTLINLMLGELMQNTPQLQVFPMEDCDEQVARIREILVKQIMFGTAPKQTYQTCASQAFIGGYSAYVVLTDYIHEKSFDLDIHYKSFKDPTKCYWDLSAEKVSKTDGMHCGWVARISKDKLRNTYGDKVADKILQETNQITATQEEVREVTQPGSNDPYLWTDDNSVTIQYHFKKTPVPETLYKLSNGHIVNQAEMDEIIADSKKIREEKIIEAKVQQQLQMQQQLQGMPAQPVPQQDPNMAPGMHDPLLGQTPIAPAPQQDMLQETFNENDIPLMLYDGQEPVRIEDEKDATKYKITFYELCGDYELKSTVCTSEQLPMPFVDQQSYYNKEGKQICRPFLIDVRDTQRYINYLATQSAYILKVSRYDQWIGSKKNVQSQGTAQQWKDPLALQGMITYDESPSGAKPERVMGPELPQSLLTQYERAIEDLYTSTGLYPARMGQQGNEISGDAIDSRTRQGSYATQVAFTSINRAIATGGEIVNEMIPKVYDSTRVIALMTPDEGMKNIVVNRQADEYGERIENDIRKGTYQVRLLPGPSYEGQKEQALASLNAAIAASQPTPVFPLIADLYAENLPLANNIEIRNRFKTLVPPQILQAGKSGKTPPPQQPQGPSPEQIEMQFKQQQLQLKQQELGIKRQELALKAQQQNSDTQIEMAKLQKEYDEIQQQMNDSELKYAAEVHKTTSAEHIAHANNFAHILTSNQPTQGNTNAQQQY